MRQIKTLVLFILFVVLPSAPIYSSGDVENPATLIMQRVIRKMMANEELKHKHLDFNKHYTVTDIDESGKTKKISANQVFHITPPNGDETLIQEDGKAKNKKHEKGGEFEKIIEALSERFQYKMASPTSECPTCPLISKDDRAFMVINFKASGDKNTGGDNIKEIMDRSVGKIYVDVENFYVQRFESNMIRTYSRGWGIFQLKEVQVTIEQGEIDTPTGKIIAVMSTEIRYRYSLFGESRGIRSWKYGSYNYVP